MASSYTFLVLVEGTFSRLFQAAPGAVAAIATSAAVGTRTVTIAAAVAIAIAIAVGGLSRHRRPPPPPPPLEPLSPPPLCRVASTVAAGRVAAPIAPVPPSPPEADRRRTQVRPKAQEPLR